MRVFAVITIFGAVPASCIFASFAAVDWSPRHFVVERTEIACEQQDAAAEFILSCAFPGDPYTEESDALVLRCRATAAALFGVPKRYCFTGPSRALPCDRVDTEPCLSMCGRIE